MSVSALKSKSSWRPKKLRLAFWLAFAAIILIIFDRQTLVEVAEDEHVWWRHLAGQVTDVASAEHWFALSIAVMCAAFLAKTLSRSAALRREFSNLFYWAAHLFLALTCTGVAVLLLKFLVGRERPEHIHGAFELWDYYLLSTDHQYQSFPSGHTQTIFVVATFFFILAPRANILFFVMAFFVALTRVFVLKHFPSDLVVGAFIGVEGSLLSIHLWSRWVRRPLQFGQSQNFLSAKSYRII